MRIWPVLLLASVMAMGRFSTAQPSGCYVPRAVSGKFEKSDAVIAGEVIAEDELRESGDDWHRLAIARQLLLNYTERIRWQRYWLPSAIDKSYVPGREIEVQALFASSAAGFCAPALNTCQIYQSTTKGGLEFVTEWISAGRQSESSLRERFAEEFRKAWWAETIQDAGTAQPTLQPHAVDLTRMAEPARSQQISEIFEKPLRLTWKLLPLAAPKVISKRIPPSDPGLLREELRETAKRFRGSSCGSSGQTVIPFYSTQDPRVFVYIDLGGGCERGVFEFALRPKGGWAFNRFIVAEIDLKELVPRIQRTHMEILKLID